MACSSARDNSEETCSSSCRSSVTVFSGRRGSPLPGSALSAPGSAAGDSSGKLLAGRLWPGWYLWLMSTWSWRVLSERSVSTRPAEAEMPSTPSSEFATPVSGLVAAAGEVGSSAFSESAEGFCRLTLTAAPVARPAFGWAFTTSSDFAREPWSFSGDRRSACASVSAALAASPPEADVTAASWVRERRYPALRLIQPEPITAAISRQIVKRSNTVCIPPQV